jgi:S-formylglutathione hydrolase FrmB
MPSDGLWGDGLAYLPHNGYDFEKWIAEDVFEALEEKIQGVTKTSPRFIGGLSMGGFGALRIGAKYTGMFQGISVHSSITSLEQMKLFVEEELSSYRQINKVDEDVYATLYQYRNSLPPIRIDCGINDPLIEYNRQLHEKLEASDVDHIYEEYDGGHEWAYWTTHVSRSLIFFANQLKEPAINYNY